MGWTSSVQPKRFLGHIFKTGVGYVYVYVHITDLLPSPYSEEALGQALNSAELWSRIGIDRVFAVPTWVDLYDCQARIAITFSAVHRARVNKVDVVERKRFADGRVAAVDPGNAPLNRKC